MTPDQQPPDQPADEPVDAREAEAGDDGEAGRRDPQHLTAAEASRQASGLAEAPGTPAPDPVDDELARLLAEGVAQDAASEDPRSREELADALAAAEARLAEVEDDSLRLRAEFANFRRRTERDAMQGRLSGRADVLGALLDVLDDFDRTIEAAADSPDDGLRSGVVMVRDKLAAALASQGLVRLDESGVPFDPSHHEAIQKVEAADGPLDAERVAQVFRPGYLHGERVLRAAMVVVEQ